MKYIFIWVQMDETCLKQKGGEYISLVVSSWFEFQVKINATSVLAQLLSVNHFPHCTHLPSFLRCTKNGFGKFSSRMKGRCG